MIIRTAFRRAGELAAHLGRTDTNETVETLDILCRDCPADDAQALRLFTAISRSNARTRRDLVHMKMSPSTVELSIEQIGVALARYEAAHGIPNTMPRKVKRHRRGDRPPHLHVVYPVVDPATGRAVRSQNNFLADEVASRCLELEFGEPIVPGPRQDRVVAVLRAQGEHDLARALDGYDPAAVGDRIGDAGYRQAATLGADLGRMKCEVDVAWTAAGGDRDSFARCLQAAGLELCQGDKAILVVDQATGAAVPLARTLRQRAKERGDHERVREPVLRAMLGDLPDLASVRTQGLAKAENDAGHAVLEELARMAEEAEGDAQRALAERLRRIRDDMANRRPKAFNASVAERRRRIAADYARRDRIRRARVLRAARLARLLDRKDLRKIMAGIATTGVLLAGGGLGLALIAAGVAVSALPTWERARAIRMEADLAQRSDRAARMRDISNAFNETVNETRAAHPQRMRFADVPRAHRALAGLYGQLVLDEVDGRLQPQDEALLADAARVLGIVATSIRDMLMHKGGRSGLVVLAWYDPTKVSQRRAAASALSNAKEVSAAARVAPAPPRSRNPKGRDR